MIDNFVRKFEKIEKSFASEKGEFELFALFRPEGNADLWDLLVAAPWIDPGRMNDWRQVASKIKSTLNQEELLKLSRIVLVKSQNPLLDEFYSSVDTKHGVTEVTDRDLFGQSIEHAYIFKAKRIGKDSS